MSVELKNGYIEIECGGGAPYNFQKPTDLRGLYFWLRQIGQKSWCTKTMMIEVARLTCGSED